MTVPLPIADSGIEALIWLVIAAVWFVIQSVAKGARRGVPSKAPRMPATRLEDNLKEFLKNIEGMGMETPPQAPPPPLEIVQPPPVKALEGQLHISRHGKKGKKVTYSAERVQPVFAPAVPDLSASAQVRQRSFKQRTVVMPRFSIPGLQVAKMGLSAVTLSASKNHEGISQAKRGFGNKRDLRKAVFARIILGPPRAFE